MAALNRLEHLRKYNLEEVQQWLSARRSSWRIAVENYGIDSNIGVMVRNHNLLAGGGIDLIGSPRWNRKVSMGSYKYEPIAHYPNITDYRQQHPERIIIAVEDRDDLPPVDQHLYQNATYLFGHDEMELTPEAKQAATIVCGAPSGWSRGAGPGMLATIVMYLLRQQDASSHKDAFLDPDEIDIHNKVDSKIISNNAFVNIQQQNNRDLQKAEEFESWKKLTRQEKRDTMKRDWWNDPKGWETNHDWWVWCPDTSYSINLLSIYRFVKSTKLQGLICPQEGPKASPRHWRSMENDKALAMFKEQGYPLFGLEHGGEDLYTSKLPNKGVLVIGNEANGLDTDKFPLDHQLTIPQYGSVRSYSAAISAGIVIQSIISS